MRSPMSSLTTPTAGAMPDVARHAKSPFTGTLDKVGMTAIEVPVRLRSAAEHGQVLEYATVTPMRKRACAWPLALVLRSPDIVTG